MRSTREDLPPTSMLRQDAPRARPLFEPALTEERGGTAVRRAARGRVPLFWQLVGVNVVVVLGGSLLLTGLVPAIRLNGTLTPITHGVVVLVAIGLSSVLSMLLLEGTLRPIRSLLGTIQRFNAGDRSARAEVGPSTDPDVALLVQEMNGIWSRLARDESTINEQAAHAERLAAQVIRAQEDERRRVARELHDEAGQALTALIIGLERGLNAMPEVYSAHLPVQPRQLIADLRDLAASTLEEVRRLAVELRPSVLDDLGLVVALRQYLGSAEARLGMPIGLVVEGLAEEGERLPPAVETALFRITQEAVTNAARHAAPELVCVRLWREPGQVLLEILDDGAGLGEGSLRESGVDEGHLGVFGMRERARLLGGALVIGPAEPRGTRVRVTVPLA